MPNRLRPSLVAVSLLAGFLLPARAQDTPPAAGGDTAVLAPPVAPGVAPLTLEDCIQRALEHGFDIEIQRYTPSIAKDFVDIARGSFFPVLSLTGSQSHSNTGPIGSAPGSKSDARLFNLGITELLQTGTSVSVSTNFDRSESQPNAFTSFYNPAYTSDFTLAVTQPLLRGAGIGVTTATLNRARIGLQRAGFDLETCWRRRRSKGMGFL